MKKFRRAHHIDEKHELHSDLNDHGEMWFVGDGLYERVVAAEQVDHQPILVVIPHSGHRWKIQIYSFRYEHTPA